MKINKLEFTTTESSEKRICELYWEADENDEYVYKVTELARKVGISTHRLNSIVKNSCRVLANWWSCEDCNHPYPFTSRTELSNAISQHNNDQLRPWLCTNCHSKREDEEKQLEENLKATKFNLIKSCFEGYCKSPIGIETLSTIDSIYLLALLRHSGSEDLSHIRPLNENKADLFTPNLDYSYEIIKHLNAKHLICVDPDSNLDLITLEEDGSFSYYIDAVKWRLPLEKNQSLQHFFIQLENKVTDEITADDYPDELSEISFRISIEECLAFLEKRITEHALPFSPGEKTRIVLSKCLEQYSVSQVYNFIWKSVQNAASFYMSQNSTKKHAANTIPGNIERQFERASANNWEITAFKRNYDLPQSTLSRVVFNTIIGTDDGGFKLPHSSKPTLDETV